MEVVRPAVPGFFPLDDELGLVPGTLTPHLAEGLVRLSTHIPSFAKASAELAFFTGVVVHPDTARRRCETAGRLLVAHEHAEAARILRELPDPPHGPDTLVFSVDGAMVPLVHGQWTEVRTLVVGEVQVHSAEGEQVSASTSQLSYFSRRLDSSSFGEQASAEVHRRGLERTKQVAALVDGAEWCQQFIDTHKPDAIRILDFAHAASYLTTIGQTPTADGPLLSTDQIAALRHELKHEGATGVLVQLRAVVGAHPELAELEKPMAYLEKREQQMAYRTFQKQGWPIGSGMVESANKLVVEERLKGAGMHWAEGNVNPLLALRNAVCNDRWDECWRVIEHGLRKELVVRRQGRRRQRTVDTQLKPSPPPALAPLSEPEPPAQPVKPKTKPVHPWRRAWSLRRQRELAGVA